MAAEILEENGTWVVRVDCDQRGVQQYSCATEKQAQNLAALLGTPPMSRGRRVDAKRGS